MTTVELAFVDHGPPERDTRRDGDAERRRLLRLVPETAADTEVVDVPRWDEYLAAYDEHGARLYRVALLLLRGDRHEAEDAVAEVFLAAHGPWLEGTIDDLSSYLRRSLTNRVVSQTRHRGVVDRFVRRQRADDRGSQEIGDAATDHVALTRALDALPAGQRAAVVLRYYEGLTVAETADALGVAEGTVKSQVSEALARLRRELREDQ